MSTSRGLFVGAFGNVATTPVEARRALAGMIEEQSPNVPRSGALTIESTNLITPNSGAISYTLKESSWVVRRESGEGVYIFSFQGTTTVAASAAPGTGSRYDLIYVKQNDPEKGDENNDVVLRVAQGQAAASPTRPSQAVIDDNGYLIAENRVYANTTGASSSPNVFAQLWRYSALRGTPIRVRNEDERSEITPSLGKTVMRLDQQQVIERATGTTWDADSGKYAELTGDAVFYRSKENWGPGVLSLDPQNSQNNDFVVPDVNDVIKFIKAGIYHVQITVFGNGAVPVGSGIKFTNKDESGVFTEMGVGNGVTWSYTVSSIVRVSPSAAAAGTFFLRFRMNMGSTYTASCRVRIARI